MMLRKYLIPAAAVLLLACTADEGDSGKTAIEPSTTPHTTDFTVDYQVAQARSSKRGLGFNTMVPDYDIPKLSTGVCWYYNWGNNCPGSDITTLLARHKMQFLPMLWNGTSQAAADNIRAYKEAMPDAQYLLAFNEPNLTDQANMTPTQAAAKWAEVVAIAKENNLKLISPALNYGTLAGYNDPVKWFDEFLACPEVNLDDMYGIALHCYMPSANAMRSSLVNPFKKYGKPIFMTEFCYANPGISNNENVQQNFMSEVLDYLEAEPIVEGYAWFMARSGGQHGSAISVFDPTAGYESPALTDLGVQFINCSSLDESRYYQFRRPIPAEHYVANSLTASINETSLAKAPTVRKTDDVTGILELRFSMQNTWAEYNIELPADGIYSLAIRYAASAAPEFTFSLDGNPFSSVQLPATDNQWSTRWLSNLNLTAGKHRLRINFDSHTDARVNWLYID